MASLDNLPADQRAVLQLVLQRGRSYEDIAKLLSIDRAAVRQRALTALDTLGPQTGVPDDRRAMITDYLLGQLPDDQRDETHDRLAESPSERAWARVLASELAPVAGQELPEIPVESSRAADVPAAPQPVAEPEPADVHESEPEIPDGERVAPVLPSRAPDRPPAPPPAPETSIVPDIRDEGDGPRKQRKQRSPGAPSSRRGGMILIGSVVVIAVAVAAVLLLNGKSSPKPQTAASASTSTTSTTSSAAASTTTSSSSAAKVVAQINLTPPTAGSKAAGIAEVLKEGANDGIAIVAQNVPANTTKPPNAYAVWLYNSATDAHILGFVNPGVGKDGRLSTAGGLPANASHFKQLIVTVETQANPKTPGTVILQGTLTGLS